MCSRILHFGADKMQPVSSSSSWLRGGEGSRVTDAWLSELSPLLLGVAM